jgi:flagellar hook-basal body complex protein FliE
MTPIGSVLSSYQNLPLKQTDGPLPSMLNPGGTSGISTTTAPQPGGFGSMLDGLVSMVDGKQANADALTNQVLLGQTGQLHQSVIAMQEASVSLSLMVQVRNKLVESYQELMRMQV